MSVYNQMYQIVVDIAEKKLNGGRKKRTPRINVLGTIDHAYTSGRPMVIMDDDPSQTPIGPYPYAASYAPVGGDRVLLTKAGSKYVVVDKIV